MRSKTAQVYAKNRRRMMREGLAKERLHHLLNSKLQNPSVVEFCDMGCNSSGNYENIGKNKHKCEQKAHQKTSAGEQGNVRVLKRLPRRNDPVNLCLSNAAGSGNVVKIDYGALVSVGVMFAIFRNPSHPMNGVFTGNYMIDLEANIGNIAEQTNTTRGFYMSDPAMPTKHKEVLAKSGKRYVKEAILLHVSKDKTMATDQESRRIFASNHAKALNVYSGLTFKFPVTYEVGNDLTATSIPHSSVLADFLTWDDVMKLMRENIFVEQTTAALASSDEIMKEYFGRNWEKARKYFLEAADPITLGMELESLY